MNITPRKIYEYVYGNLSFLGSKFHLIPDHKREQVLYRSEICKDDCVKYGYCVNCGCDLPAKFYVKKTCNGGNRFPDMMSAEKWEAYKIENNIEIR